MGCEGRTNRQGDSSVGRGGLKLLRQSVGGLSSSLEDLLAGRVGGVTLDMESEVLVSRLIGDLHELLTNVLPQTGIDQTEVIPSNLDSRQQVELQTPLPPDEEAVLTEIVHGGSLKRIFNEASKIYISLLIEENNAKTGGNNFRAELNKFRDFISRLSSSGYDVSLLPPLGPDELWAFEEFKQFVTNSASSAHPQINSLVNKILQSSDFNSVNISAQNFATAKSDFDERKPLVETALSSLGGDINREIYKKINDFVVSSTQDFAKTIQERPVGFAPLAQVTDHFLDQKTRLMDYLRLAIESMISNSKTPFNPNSVLEKSLKFHLLGYFKYHLLAEESSYLANSSDALKDLV